MRRHTVLLLLSVLTSACFAVGAIAHDEPTTVEAGKPIALTALGKSAVGIEVQSVEKKSLPMEISVPGKIEVMPTRQFDEHAPLSGRVFSVNVMPGEVVKEGQVLAIVDSPEMNTLAAQLLQNRLDIESEIAKQQAALDEEVSAARQRLDLDDANLNRVTKLRDNRIAAQKDVIAAQTEDQIATTRLNTATKNRDIVLKTLRSRLELTLVPIRQRLHLLGVDENEIAGMLKKGTTLTQVPVYAAHSGFVTAISASAGKSIDPSVSLFTIADLNKVWATADVYEDEMSRMRIGQSVHVDVHALPEDHFNGTLTFVGTQVDPVTRTLPVRAELDNPQYKLKPDMYADLYIRTSNTEPVVAVPREAIIASEGRNLAFVEVKDGYQPLYVKVGRTAGNLVEVVAGLEPGQRLVTRGAFQLSAEFVKLSGGSAQFAQATEGEHIDEDAEKKPTGGLSVQSVALIGIAAFILGFGICALFLFRGKTASSVPLEAPGADAAAERSSSTSRAGKSDHV
jgi:cobalt-zinc-cadmium efflux system membrane fusion protein